MLLMANEHILVVDDEESILELLEYNLSREGYIVTGVATGEKAIKAARSKLPNLVILDLMLPGVDGLEVCKTLKSDPKTSHIPIVMLTAKGEEADIVTGLELGADDYVTKPFSPRVLLARMKAVLRRKAKEVSEEPTIITVKEMTIDPSRHEVLIKSKPVVLTNTEFRLLYLLASRPGRVFTRYQIIDNVRGDDYIATDRSVDVQIVGLRRKLRSYGNHIETVRGVGYRFKD
jgi:two-component system phosphate regulon response regulator PhoB